MRLFPAWPIFIHDCHYPCLQRRRACPQQIRVFLAADKAETQIRIVALPTPQRETITAQFLRCRS